MPDSQTTATLYRGDQVLDIAVPARSTVAGVLAQVSTASDPVDAFDELGRKLSETEVFGTTIPAGATIFLRSKHEVSSTERTDAAKVAEQVEQRTSLAPLAAICILAALSPIISLLLSDNWPLRITLAAVLASAAVSLLWRLATQPIWHGLVAPVTAAAAAAALVPHPTIAAGWSYALVFTWAGALAAMLVPTLHRHEHYESAIRLWFIPAVGLSIISIAQTDNAVAAPLGVAAAVAMLGLAPSLSVRVPDEQLIDMPAVMSTAPSVHAPETHSPSRITSARVRHTLRLASGLHTVAISTACIVLIASAPGVMGYIGEPTIEGWAALALVCIAFAHFLLQPRDSRTAFARWTPRMVVVALLCSFLLLRPPGDELVWITGAALGAAGCCAVGIWIKKGMYAPLITRMADVFERVALGLAIPAAIVTCGLFSAIRASV